MPEWLTGVVFLIGLPALMVLLQRLVYKLIPRWRRGEHNDVTAIMLSSAVVVYSVAIGLCVVTLWEKRDDARQATEAEATNLAALAEGSRVFPAPVRDRVIAGVIAYNRDVVDGWPARTRGDASANVGRDLDGLVQTVSELRPGTDAQRAFVDEAVSRLARGTELRVASLRLARDQQLPDVLWVAVIGGSLVVLTLCLTCGVRDGVVHGILLAGVAATVGINLFLVIELNYPFYGAIAIGSDSYADVVTALETPS
jgi:hypothetical protein